MPWEEGDAPNGFSSAKPWLPVKPNHSALNVAAQNADPDSTLNFYRRALAFRRAHPVFASGDIEFLKVAEPLLAFRRTDKDLAITCLFNLSAAPLTVTLDGGEGLEPLELSHGAERRKSKLKLDANGFAFFATSEMKVAFGGRRKR